MSDEAGGKGVNCCFVPHDVANSICQIHLYGERNICLKSRQCVGKKNEIFCLKLMHNILNTYIFYLYCRTLMQPAIDQNDVLFQMQNG